MKKIFLLLTIATVIFMSACNTEKGQSEILNEKVTLENLPKLAAKARKDNKLTKDELSYFITGINYIQGSKDTLLNKTVGQIIDIEEKRQMDVIYSRLDENSNRVAINLALSFGISDFRALDTNGRKYNIFTYQLANLSNKNLVAVKGMVEFLNPQSALVKRFLIDINREIPVGKTLTQPYPYEHLDSNQRDMLVRSQIKTLRPVWKPTLVKFADGTELKLKQM